MSKLHGFVHKMEIVELAVKLRDEEAEAYRDQNWDKVEGLEFGKTWVNRLLNRIPSHTAFSSFETLTEEFLDHQRTFHSSEIQMDHSERKMIEEAFRWLINYKDYGPNK